MAHIHLGILELDWRCEKPRVLTKISLAEVLSISGLVLLALAQSYFPLFLVSLDFEGCLFCLKASSLKAEGGDWYDVCFTHARRFSF